MKTAEHWWNRTKAQMRFEWSLTLEDQARIIQAIQDAQDEAKIEGLREADGLWAPTYQRFKERLLGAIVALEVVATPASGDIRGQRERGKEK